MTAFFEQYLLVSFVLPQLILQANEEPTISSICFGMSSLLFYLADSSLTFAS